MLLEEGLLIVCDATTGQVLYANETTVFLLELSEDSFSDYSFSLLCESDNEGTSELWSELAIGVRRHWTGSFKGILSGTKTPVQVTSTLTRADGTGAKVVLFARVVDSASASGPVTSGILEGLESYLGVIEFNADGRVLAATDRAETALEFFGGDLVGKSHDALWAKASTLVPGYIEFWDKLRQGRIVEGCHLHVSGEGNPVWLQSTYVPIRDEMGTLRSVKQCLMDVNDRITRADQDAFLLDALRGTTPIIIYDNEGFVIDATEAIPALFQTKRADIAGRSITRLLDPEFQRSPAYTDAMGRIKEGLGARIDIHHRTDAGQSIWMRAALVPVKGADGKLERIVEVAFDITGERQRLADLELRYDIISDFMGIMDFSPSGEVLNANRRYLGQTGLQEEDLIGKDYKSLVPHDVLHSPSFNDFWDKITSGETVSGEFRRLGAAGNEVWLQSTYAPLRSRKDERLTRIMCCTRNITEQKLNDAENAAKVRAVEQVMGVAEFTPQGKLSRASAGYLDLLDYTLEEVRDQEHKVFCPAEMVEGDGYATLWMRLRAGETRKVEDRRIAKGNRNVWLNTTYIPLKDHRGNILRVIEFARDVTEHTAQFNSMLQRIKAADTVFGMIEFDTTGTIIDYNEGFLRMIGYSARGLQDQHHSVLCAPEESISQDYRDFWLSLGKGEKRTGQFHLRGHMGREISIIGTYLPIKDMLGQVSRIVLFSLEVSEFMQFRHKSLNSADTALLNLEELLSAQTLGKAEFEALSEALDTSRQTIEAGKSALSESISEFRAIGDSVRLIQETVTMVSEIATQTNLLAFNAAIEAARVGKNGEGFSIVADEVRRLAERNTAAAREIMTQVKFISDRLSSSAKGSETAASTMTDSNKAMSDIHSRVSRLIGASATQSEKAVQAVRVVGALREAAKG
jgi:methyl-accepting chemotaxis protein